MAARVTSLMVPGLPPPVSHYADATIANGFLFISGVTAAGPDGLVGAGDITAQAEYVFEIIGKVLTAAGAGFSDITKLSVYLTSMDDRAAVNEVRKRIFGSHRPARHAARGQPLRRAWNDHRNRGDCGDRACLGQCGAGLILNGVLA